MYNVRFNGLGIVISYKDKAIDRSIIELDWRPRQGNYIMPTYIVISYKLLLLCNWDQYHMYHIIDDYHTMLRKSFCSSSDAGMDNHTPTHTTNDSFFKS
jgi:hypothetical protein